MAEMDEKRGETGLAGILSDGEAGMTRRRFLTLAGFSFVGAAGWSEAAERKALALPAAVEGLVPGRILQYASTCLACPSGCGILARTRDGRPIKLEGNPEHPLSQGGLCAVGQASILGLYDSQRLTRPLRKGRAVSWPEIDADVLAALEEARRGGGAVRILSRTRTSPTERAWIARFLNRFPDARHVTYDPLSASAILEAHRRTHGRRILPRYRIDKAVTIVSFDADFLGTWISPVEFTRGYRKGRSLEGAPPRFSWHAQVESRLSITGAKADLRIRCAPDEAGSLLTGLADRIARRANVRWAGEGVADGAGFGPKMDDLADRLWQSRGRSLVLCGSQEADQQVLCNFLNHLLGNYGETLEIDRPSLQRQGDDGDLLRLKGELEEGAVAALLLLDCNPAYELPGAWGDLIGRVPLSAACSERMDETAARATHVCPFPHALASWGDAEPVAGRLGLLQPTFPALGETRTILESLAAWSGAPGKAKDLVRAHWQESLFPKVSSASGFRAFWDKSLHDGFAEIPVETEEKSGFVISGVRPATPSAPRAAGTFALVLYPKAGLLDGSHAYNPWLQELPDPVTKAAWDNYICVSPSAARDLGLKDGSLARVRAGDAAIDLPILVQPGQDDRTLAVALGYGSRLSERFAAIGPKWLEGKPSLGSDGKVGKNAAPLLSLEEGALRAVRLAVSISPLGGESPLATTQTYHAIAVPAGLAPAGQERRPMVQETTVEELPAGLKKGHAGGHGDLWPDDHPAEGHRWGMVIDLAACTGCSACVVACQVENNVPVVGRDEVRRQREMHWIRLDRYYDEDPKTGDVDVSFQPMLCQHCGNAPCETVCPVLATVHSAEGLNQQVYNRCVGTRYCANNCPYKVRRFNWFDYAHEDALANLGLNPEVTVRSRGVMEKCSFCVQRIQEGKLAARAAGQKLADGAVQAACQQSCPAEAIRFGDLADPKSAVARLARDGRNYRVLDELNVKPVVSYLAAVRNRPGGGGDAHE